MVDALNKLRSEFCFELDVLDVDSDPVLETRYDELVPVLVAGGAELCHYFLDEPKVRTYLAEFKKNDRMC